MRLPEADVPSAKAYRQLPMLGKALDNNMQEAKAKSALDTIKEAA